MSDPGLPSILQDVDGNYSSKRVAAFIALAAFIVGFIADTFTSHHPSQYMVDDLMIIILGGLSMAVAERFAPRKETKP